MQKDFIFNKYICEMYILADSHLVTDKVIHRGAPLLKRKLLSHSW